jgi:hypothetical protein
MMMTTSHISTKVTSQIDVGMHGVGASMYSSMLNRMATGCRFFFLGDLVRSEWVCRDLEISCPAKPGRKEQEMGGKYHLSVPQVDLYIMEYPRVREATRKYRTGPR